MHSTHEKLLVETSRTFALPILRAPSELQDPIGLAYLSMRAIDEIEDSSVLENSVKSELLRGVARCLRHPDGSVDLEGLRDLMSGHEDQLHEVTLRFPEIAEAIPDPVRPIVIEATAEMAEDMGDWVDRNWLIRTKDDLDAYTFSVAGRVGLLLSGIWHWYEGISCSNEESIGFGRALQAVNILRNRDEDLSRGVDFFPDQWGASEMMAYTRQQIELAQSYMRKLDPKSHTYKFCIIPLTLATATLEVIEEGREKLSRPEINNLIASLDNVE